MDGIDFFFHYKTHYQQFSIHTLYTLCSALNVELTIGFIAIWHSITSTKNGLSHCVVCDFYDTI